MRTVLTIAILLCAVVASSQKNSVGLSVSPGLSYRVYQEKQNYFGGHREEPKFSYSITASFEHKFHKRASFFTGLSFINDGYQSEKLDLRYSDQLLPKRGFVLPTSEEVYTAIRYRYSFYQISIPVGVNYFIPIKKIKLFFSAGVSANYLINVRYASILYATDGNDRVSKRDDDKVYYKDFNFSAFASFGIEAKIAPKYNLRVFPSLSYNFTNVMDNDVYYKTYLYATNIGIGVYRQL